MSNQSAAIAQRLRQAILKRAFEDKLLPQDLSNAPASVLLEWNRQKRKVQGDKQGVRQTRMEAM
jgi:hypothetical protein